MPEFRTVPLSEARLKTATGRQARYAQEYAEYIQQLGRDEAGVLVAGEGERVPTIRRRLTVTAELLGKTLAVKRRGDVLYFWVEPPEEPAEEERPRRRGGRGRTEQAVETPGGSEGPPPFEIP